MQNLDDLKATADAAQSVWDGWQDTLKRVQLASEAATRELVELYQTRAIDVVAMLDRIAVLEARVKTAKSFATWYVDSGLRHEISTKKGNALTAYYAAKKHADAARQKLADDRFAALQAQAQFEDTQGPGAAPQARNKAMRQGAAHA